MHREQSLSTALVSDVAVRGVTIYVKAWMSGLFGLPPSLNLQDKFFSARKIIQINKCLPKLDCSGGA